MFCMQCEQTRNGSGCATVGVCGKTPEVAALQDLLVDKLKGIAFYAHRAGLHGATSANIDRFALDALFATLTNVNFDPERFRALIKTADALRPDAELMYKRAAANVGAAVETSSWPAVAQGPTSDAEYVHD
jgi:hydroxylamine reductase